MTQQLEGVWGYAPQKFFRCSEIATRIFPLVLLVVPEE